MRPEDCDLLFAERVNAGDVEGALDLYEKDGVYVLRGRVAVGPDEIRPLVERLVASKGTLSCRVTRVVPAGDGLALLYNEWTLAVPGDGGDSTRAGKALELVRRQPDGAWRFVIDDPYGRI